MTTFPDMLDRMPVPSSSTPSSSSSSPHPPPLASDNQPNHKFRMEDFRRDFESSIDHEASSASMWREVSSVSPQTSSAAYTDSISTTSNLPPQLIPLDSSASRSTERMIPRKPVETNPFLKRQQTGQSHASTPSGPSAQPSLLDFDDSAPKLSNLSINEPTNNPWQPELETNPPDLNVPVPTFNQQDSGSEVWTHIEAPNRGGSGEKEADRTSSRASSPAWDEGPETPIEVTPPSLSNEETNVWKENSSLGHTVAPVSASRDLVDDWTASSSVGVRSQPSHLLDASVDENPASRRTEIAPELPPRRVDTMQGESSSNEATIPSSTDAQRKETYDIKKISWYDHKAQKNPRVSPILVQNLNGPCPLLALVNALILSTPADMATPLVETLRTREQVSLGLLLDAVFDELMSGRRGDALATLPDVSDLYAFLITLHTGMNVNPLFIPDVDAESQSSADLHNPTSLVHPAERCGHLPGTFEATRELKLYGTFAIPLIHGWLPPKNSPAYIAMRRSAKSYEDAQNLMFREEELENKLQGEGLSFEEQATLEDIATINAFISSSATQLTEYGLETIRNATPPGSVAIFFRNDHFSTLYRHPETHQLFQLVTDMGYAGHQEVVWESLVDVNGENCEFFSGDFRLVGGAAQGQGSSQDDWTTVERRRRNQNSQSSSGHRSNIAAPEPPREQYPGTSAEQEDHDLALAMQLQEEEEERHRSELARRRRETELSQQYIEQQGRSDAVNIPVTRGRGGGPGARGGRGARPAGASRPAQRAPPINTSQPPRRGSAPNPRPATTRPADPEAGIDAPPPTYEQAASEEPYNPPPDHPAHPNASPQSSTAPSLHGRRASQPAYLSNGQQSAPMRPTGRNSSRPSLINEIQQHDRGKDRDCVLM